MGEKLNKTVENNQRNALLLQVRSVSPNAKLVDGTIVVPVVDILAYNENEELEKLREFKKACEEHWKFNGYEKQHWMLEAYEKIFGVRPEHANDKET